MRLRKRFLVIAILAFVLVGGGYFYYNQPHVQARIREAVIQSLMEATGGEISIDSLSIGLLSATANGLFVSLNSRTIQIEIEKIRVGVGLIRLPNFRRFNAQDFVDRIIIINPKIKIIPYSAAEEKDDDDDENLPKIDSLLASEWSKLIVENVPFQSAGIRNCEIEIITNAGRRLAYFSGLNGNLQRRNGELNVELSGVSGSRSLRNNVSISARITPKIERQFLSLKFDNVPIVSPLMQLDGDLSFLIDGDMDIMFADKHFPEALVPNGRFSVRRLRVRQKDRGITFTGSMDILASEGVLNAQNITAKFGKGEAAGFAKMDLNRGGRAVGELNVSIEIDEKTSVKARNLFHLTQIVNPELYFRTEGHIDSKKEELADFKANGKITEGRAVLRNLDVKSKFGGANFTGFVVPGVNYSLDGFLALDAKIDDNTSAYGNAKILVKGDDFVRFPQISGVFSDLKLKKDENFLDFPEINLQTQNETLRVAGNESGLRISAEMKLKENFAYTADLGLDENKVKEIFTFLGRNFPLDNGNLSAKISGDTAGFNFTANTKVSTEKHGDFAAGVKGQISQKQQNFTIDALKWTINKQTLDFKGNMKNTPNGWAANLSSANLSATATFDSNFTEITSGNLSINKFPLKFFNAFDKRKDKESDLILAGEVSGSTKFGGYFDKIWANGNLRVQNAQLHDLKNLSANLEFSVSDSVINLPVFSIKQGNKFLLRSRRFEKIGDKFFAELAVDDLALENFLPFAGISDVRGNVSARINADGEKIVARVISDSIFYQIGGASAPLKIQNIKTQVSLCTDSVFLDRFESEILGLKTTAEFRANHRGHRVENAVFSVNSQGDFLAAAGSFKESPIGGKGAGTISFSGNITEGELRITNGRIIIPSGEMSVYPFVRGSIENVFADMKTTGRNRVSVAVQGVLDRRRLTIRNDYNVGELTPFRVANLNLGVLRVWTDRGGIPVFLPGFMENRRGNVGYIETARKGDIPTLTIASHPDNFVMLAGTLLLRKTDITFPLLDDVEYPFDFDVFPHLYFDLDIRPADRSVRYFYQIGREDRRRGIRIIECVIDPSGTIGVRGNDADGTFRVVGRLRSNSGYMFYGRMFDRNFEIGLDFQPEPLQGGFGYDNLPIIWGRAETFSDTNRLERVSVRLKTRDERTGELRSRGRFTSLVIVPESDNINRPQDEAAAEYYRSIGGLAQAGEMAATLGDNYISGFFLNYWGRQIARKIGLDMFRFETAIMGNSLDFLMQRQLDEATTQNWNYMAFAGSGFTAGKYLGNDFLLKYQAELMPQDFSLIPRHKFGIEYQPLPYLWLDFNYGFHQESQTNEIITNPEVRMQVRMPFSDLRRFFNRRQQNAPLTPSSP